MIKEEIPSVAVVILNWNGKALLEKFLPSVVQSSYENLQLIVGDNASTDDSISFLRASYPTIRIIQNQVNLGFAGGYNQILKQVEADYLVLLNSDVEVPKNWIKPVIDLMESDSQIAVAQPKLKWQVDPKQFEYAGAAGGFIDRYGYPFCRGRIFDSVEQDKGQYDQNMDVFWASGAALFIRNNCWKEVEGLDADFFAHMEEIDLCWRLKNLGYRIVSCCDAEVFHVGGGTLNAVNPYKTYLNFRNNLLMMQKNLPKNEVFKTIFVRFWLDFAAWLQFLIKGKVKFAMAISKAHLHFLRQLGKNRKKRSTQQIPLNNHTGVYRSSIVLAYFLNKIKKFSQLKWY